MDKQEFNQNLDSWKQIAEDAGVRLPMGNKLPERFWALFLGLAESTFNKYKGNEADKRGVPPYTTKHIRRINLLPRDIFIRELETTLAEYVEKARADKVNRSL